MKGKTTKQALCGIYRVLDLADDTGVYCGKLLADLGADVIKVEPPEGDKTRSWPPFYRDEVDPEKSLYFLFYNTNKRSITLNLENGDGREIFKRLVSGADVLIETFPPGYLQDIGLGYDALSELNPGLVMTSITPFGQTGPYKDYKSSDLIQMAISGYCQVSGEPDGVPIRFGYDLSNLAASQCAAAGTLVALFHRNAKSGTGQHIDISIMEAICSYQQDAAHVPFWRIGQMNVLRNGVKSRRSIPWGGFECKDGWTYIGAVKQTEWDSFSNWAYEVSGEKEIVDPLYSGDGYARLQYIDVLDMIITKFTKKLTKEELFQEGEKRDIGVFPCYTVAEVANSPQLAARDFFLEADHPEVGRMKYPRTPYLIEGAPLPIRRAAPRLGEHNEEIYVGEMGLAKEQLAIMRTAGII